MHEQVKELWTEALRSGKYTQTTGALRRVRDGVNENVEPPEPVKAGFCCMGVLCDISDRHTWSEPGLNDGAADYMGFSGVLPPDVMDWAGLNSEDGILSGGPDTGNENLVSHNDAGSTFAEIADLIDQHWEEL